MDILKMLAEILLLVVGFVFLIKGADVFVEGASKIAVKCNIPEMVVGLTIVALGTSAPEAAVSIKAAFSGVSDMTIGNVVGSNIMNILLILGAAALFAALPFKKNTLRIDIPLIVVCTLLLLCLGYFDGKLGRVDGIIFWIVLVAFIVYLVISAKNGESESEIELTEKDKYPRLILCILIGIAFIIVGSNLTVNAASYIAEACGMTPRLISLTIVAFGTSLPELVTSCTAAKKGQTDIAIGKIVGSNILNILFVAGTTMLITPVTFSHEFLFDCVVAVLAAVILFVCCVGDKKLTKKEGIFMLVVYAVYFGYIMVKNYA
jgi:cation:H+ antiporter